MSNRFAALDLEDEEGARPKGGKTAGKKAAAAPAAAPVAAPKAEEERPAKERRPEGGATNSRDKPYDRHIPRHGFKGKGPVKGGAGAGNWGSTDEEARRGGVETDAPAATEAADATTTEAAPVDDADDGKVTLESVLKAREEKRAGALFSVAKEDTSKLLDQFKGTKKVDDVDNDEDKFFIKTHGSTKKAEETAKANTTDLSSLLSFKVGPAEVSRERRERPEGAPRGRGGSRGGARPPRTDRPEGEGERSDRAEGSRGRGGRGGRGTRGGRGGRGGAREGGAPASASHTVKGSVDVNDSNAFPALGH
jgi:hypothetical protein